MYKWTKVNKVDKKGERINKQRISAHAHQATNRHYENKDEQNRYRGNLAVKRRAELKAL